MAEQDQKDHTELIERINEKDRFQTTLAEATYLILDWVIWEFKPFVVKKTPKTPLTRKNKKKVVVTYNVS